jgi:endothelin-converting enzyme/putative endopeptidase
MLTRGVLLVPLAVAACGSPSRQATHQTAPPSAVGSTSEPARHPVIAATPHGVELSDIDVTQDPCIDFYEYANGAWRASNPIPASMQRWSRRWVAAEATKDRLRAILDDLSQRSDWLTGSVEQVLADYYTSCMDERRRDEQNVSPLAPVLGEIDAMKGPRDVQRLIAELHDLDIGVPFGLSSSPDPDDPTRVIANIVAGGLGLPDRDYYLKPDRRFADARQRYQAHAARIFQLTGLTAGQARAAAGVVFAMEKQLAEAQLDNVAIRDPKALYHKIHIAQLARLAPHLDWQAYLRAAHLEISDANVEQPRFLKEVDRQLAQTPMATWKSYLKWQVLSDAAESLSAASAEEDFAFSGAYLRGEKENKPLWKRCVESTDALFGDALGKEYVQRHFPPAAKARMLELVTNILAAMKHTIDGLTSMGPETKKRALEKLAHLNTQIGYPETWKDYSSVRVARDTFWANVAAARKFGVDSDRSRIGKPADRTRWRYATPTTSNAYYDPPLNEIVFPAGILQPPAFRLDAVDAVNYGAIGVMIGHEVTHAFDDEGARYNAAGQLENWWAAADLEEFRKRSQCVVDQFESYFIEPGIHHNGRLVLGESISDLAGVKLAWLGFERARAANPAPTLDGLSPGQQFFIAWGQFFGDAIRPDMQRLMVQGDEHPTARYRINGPLSNLASFQEAFACKGGLPMVRPAATRCEVW